MKRSTRRGWRLGMALLASAAAVAALRQASRTQGYRQSLPWKLFDDAMQALDLKFGWHRVPLPVALAMLIGIRNILRQRNLYDTTQEPAIDVPPIEPPSARYLTARSPDGSYNDLAYPRMGMAHSRFGRNVPIERTYPATEAAILNPNPRIVSLELMTRKSFQPATTLNALAAAWLQFMIR